MGVLRVPASRADCFGSRFRRPRAEAMENLKLMRRVRRLVSLRIGPSRAISFAIRVIAASALPGRQQMTKSSA